MVVVEHISPFDALGLHVQTSAALNAKTRQREAAFVLI